MSFFAGKDPALSDARASDAIEQVIIPRTVDSNGFEIRRALPSARSRMVGPFIFFDQMGPAMLHSGKGVDVRPHPHIGLATVTYLFDGEIVHRDSLGTEIEIRPGAVNWMSAGRGIAHSERTALERRVVGGPLHGLQLWVPLPLTDEERDPAFAHTPAADIPELKENGLRLRVVAGTMHGLRSPVVTPAETIFANAHLKAGTRLPIDPDHEERAIYVISGARSRSVATDTDRIGCCCCVRGPHHGRRSQRQPSCLGGWGGATMDGPRHIWWNFVSSRKERIEAAKADWKAGRFHLVPGDTEEFIPLPE